MGHDHQHATAHTPTRRLWWAFGLTTTFLMIEVIGGLITQSLALLSEYGLLAGNGISEGRR